MKLGFIGAGNMGSAIIKGILNKQALQADEIYLSRKHPEKSTEFVNTGIHVMPDNTSLVQAVDCIVLAIKPVYAREVIDEIHEALNGKFVISIVAGWTYEMLKKALPQTTRFVRVMPNTPLAVGEGRASWPSPPRASHASTAAAGPPSRHAPGATPRHLPSKSERAPRAMRDALLVLASDAGLGRVKVLPGAPWEVLPDDAADDHRNDRDDDGAEERCAESVDDDACVRDVAREEARELKHERVDDECEQAKAEDGERQADDLEHRLDAGVHDGEEQRCEEGARIGAAHDGNAGGEPDGRAHGDGADEPGCDEVHTYLLG